MKNMYIVAIDYRASFKPMTIDYKMLESDNLIEAMSEAEIYFDSDKVYLLKIAQADKVGHKVKGMRGVREITFTDIFTYRGYGWHRTDAYHGETAYRHTVWVNETKDVQWITNDFV